MGLNRGRAGRGGVGVGGVGGGGGWEIPVSGIFQGTIPSG